MPQNEYIEEHIRRHGHRLDHFERQRKKEARSVHKQSQFAQKVRGFRAKLFHQKRHNEKIQMKKQIAMHEQRKNKHEEEGPVRPGAIPSYLMDRKEISRAKILSNSIKQKRKEKAGKWNVPLPKVRGIPEAEIFKVMHSGKKSKETMEKNGNQSNFCW